MVSIIKNQLLKHLSRYTKNLSSDKINLSTFRGEGELSNLELDEAVLTDLLELPSWLRLTSAWVNHVGIRIPWTKLKSVPITLTLDEVRIRVETCEFARDTSGGGGASSAALPGIMAGGKYTFVNKIIDGITIVVNTVNVTFVSQAFTASIQMSRIRVESKTPKWMVGDLRVTRLKDTTHGHLLIFKELSWQTVRIEASSTQDTSLTPLRLLTNQASCRITIKKKLLDCSVLSSRLVLVLDDLLWVLTDSQMKAALHFVDSLSDLIKASTELNQKTKARKKLETMPDYQSQIIQQSTGGAGQGQGGVNSNESNESAAQKFFNMFDVRETSYHFFSKRIDLHLCDDDGGGRSCYPELKSGGALQISVQGYQVDYYPFHLAKTNRSHWPRYKESSTPPAMWLEQSLNQFKETLLNYYQPNRATGHAPLERTVASPATPATASPGIATKGSVTEQMMGSSGASTPSSSSTATGATIATSPMRRNILENLGKLMSACVVLRIEDFTLHRVTTAEKKQMPKEFISGDKDRYSFPTDLSALHAEFTYFYYPGDFSFPLPPSKIFVHINPVQLTFDLPSLLWLNSFALNLHESLLRTSVGGGGGGQGAGGGVVTGSMQTPTNSTSSSRSNQQPSSSTATDETPTSSTKSPSLMYMDVKLEAILPRIVFEAPPLSTASASQRDRPKIMQAQISRFSITNIREMGTSRADLAQALSSLQEGNLVFSSGFPAKDGDMCIVTDRILSHVAAADVLPAASSCSTSTLNNGSGSQINSPLSSSSSSIPRHALWTEPRDIWCIKLDPIWVEFFGARSIGANKSIPFVDAVPVTLWVHGKGEAGGEGVADIGLSSSVVNKTADLHVIGHVSNLISVQIDHYQLLFLLRLSEQLTELTTFLTLDRNRILKEKATETSMIVGCVIPQVEVTLVMPSPTPGKESTAGDGESVVPDTASLADDLQYNTSSQLLRNNTNPFSMSIDSPTSMPMDPLPFEGFSLNPMVQQQQSMGGICSNPIPMGGSASNSMTTSSGIGSASVKLDPLGGIQTTMTTSSGGGGQGGAGAGVGSAGSGTGTTRRNRNSVSDATNFPKDINTGFMSMKKGFSSLMTSIDTAFKAGVTVAGGLSDDMSDTLSIRSDASSDSENFVLTLTESEKGTDCMDVMFKLNPNGGDANLKVAPVEMATEIMDEVDVLNATYKTNLSSPSEPSEASSWKRRDLVSMVTFRLTTVEVIRQNEGPSSSARLQVAGVSCNECGAIPWDELQSAHQTANKTKFGARCRGWNMGSTSVGAQPSIQLRFEEELNLPKNSYEIVDKKAMHDWFGHKVDIKVSDVNLSLTMSTVIGLGDLLEDEVEPRPLPVEILLRNVRLNLVEDRPPVNITSPGPQPMNVAIGEMKVRRDSSGVIHLQPSVAAFRSELQQLNLSSQSQVGREKELLSLQLILKQMKLDNDNLRRQLTVADKQHEQNRMKTLKDAEALQGARKDIATLLEEKRTLLDTVRSLQSQLSSAMSSPTSPDEGKYGQGHR